ncbi:unnamed protein product, partial [Mesorhabditis belari]|uniref:Sulfotransferase domain-containing protein n=1 Tax=Mesorhabditis belari TaxID=2138241 RepID=A0AAF3FP29_9BILA
MAPNGRLIFLLFYLIFAIDGAPIGHKEKRFPSAIIIGVKKAGTRALLEFLRLNQKIHAPGPEVHFFDKNYEKGLEWYRNQMPETTWNEVTIEKSPAYFVSKSAPERIRQMNPKMKLIVVVRDPVTRAISDYTQASLKKKRLGMMPSFERMAVGDCSGWLKTNCTAKTRGVNANWGAIRLGIYHRHMRHWLNHFPLDQIHFVDGERLIRDPASEVASTERFLGLEPMVHDADFAVDPIKGFPCVRRNDQTLHCLGKSKGRKHPNVDRKVLEKLERFYQPENEIFFRLINKHFSW